MPSKYICLYVHYWLEKQSQSSYVSLSLKPYLSLNIVSILVWLYS